MRSGEQKRKVRKREGKQRKKRRIHIKSKGKRNKKGRKRGGRGGKEWGGERKRVREKESTGKHIK